MKARKKLSYSKHQLTSSSIILQRGCAIPTTSLLFCQTKNRLYEEKLLVIALLLGTAQLSLGQTKKAITHEDLWLMKRVAAPEISPDGKWVVFNVTDPSYDEKEQSTDLWIVASDGSTKPRKLTSSKAGESGYKWNPDGSSIAFSAKRDADETAQIYILNLKSGGEAQRFTNLSTGASNPNWSPDGKQIAFTSRVYAEALTDSANKKIAEEKKNLNIKPVFTPPSLSVVGING